jgi:hypothetical protein
MASVGHDKVPGFRGTFMFDGRVLESFGFGEIQSTRIPIELIESIELKLDRGLMKTPSLRVEAGGGSLGLEQPFEPADAEVPALEALAEAVRGAIASAGRG